ncbi:MAG: acyltransferase, partial [Muribaculaceae bacterium]|nr:acyltransferase [Muribaculaceae bacterium]
QRQVMLPFLEMLAMKTTKGVKGVGFDKLDIETSRTYISNHRDIVLDASFLNLCLVRTGHHTCEIALGNNLLIYSWIEDLVKLNKSFIVKRNLRLTQALEAARQLSGYMHYCIQVKHESTWIAQREGRAKDSNDMTQESLIKMLTMGSQDTPVEAIKALNITPISITYEYDPCDFLKATEYLLKRRDPDFHKSERDDLLSMETGILGYKGRVVFTATQCINDLLADLDPTADRQTCVHTVAQVIDKLIHCNYHIFPGNYIAYDRVEETPRFKDQYSEADVEAFDKYINGQLDKVELKDVSPDERLWMKDMIQQMYANPLRNYLKARGID